MITSKYIKKVVILSITVVLLLIGNVLNTDDVYAVTGTPAAPLVDITVPEKINLKPNEECIATVSNNGICDVRISVSFKAVSNWNLVQMNTDFSKMAADQNKLAVSMNNQDLVTNSAKCTVLRMSSENLLFNSKTPIRKNAIVEQKVGDFIFTFTPKASNTLVDGNTFNNLIHELNSASGNNLPFSKVAFVDEAAPQGVTLYDFSSKKDNGVVGWYDAATTTLKISTQRTGVKILANVNCANMLHNCYNLKEINTSNLDTSQVTNMQSMFSSCSSLQTLNLLNWDTSQVTNMQSMFSNCESLKELNAKNWNTSQVNNMCYMFGYCSSLQNLNIGSWNTSQVTNMQSMFNGCKSLQTIDLSSWNTSQVTDMSSMFFVCSSLQTLNISGWNTSQVTDMAYMFDRCTNLNEIYTPKNIPVTVELANVTDKTFYDVDTGKEYLAGTFPTGNVTSVHLTTQKPKTYELVDGSTFNSVIKNYTVNNVEFTDKVAPAGVTLNYSFDRDNDKGIVAWEDTSTSTLYISTQKIDQKIIANANCEEMFFNCTNLKEFAIGNLDTSKITNLKFMFYGCSLLQKFNIVGWNTSQVTDMSNMFNGCTSLQTLNLSNWDTSQVTDMNSMFSSCSSLQTLNLSNWDTSQVTNMQSMFSSCSSLQTLNAKNWNTSQVTNMSYMFIACWSLQAVDIGGWNTSQVTDMSNMFGMCGSLQKLNISGWNTSQVIDMSGMFDRCTNLNEIYTPKNIPVIVKLANITDKAFYDADTGKEYPARTFPTGNATSVHLTTQKPKTYELVDGSTFISRINTYITNVEFTDKVAPAGATLNYSLDKDGDNGVVAWEDKNTSTLYISTQKNGQKVIADANCSRMFESCSNLTIVNASNLDTSKVTDMGYMFAYCHSLQRVNINSWDTSQVTNMKSMFAYCMSLHALDVSNWNASQVTDMSSMLLKCTSLGEIYTPKNIPVTANITDITFRQTWYDADTGKEYPAGTFPTGNAASVHLVSNMPI